MDEETKSDKKSSIFSSKWRYPLILLLVIVFFAFTFWGRTFIKTILLLPALWPDVKIKPLELFYKAPIKEETEIDSSNEKIKLDIYRPNDFKKHPAIILSIVAADPTSDLMVKYIKGFAQIGFVVVVPKIEMLYSNDTFYYRFIEIDHHENIFKFVYQKDYVDNKKIGYFGFCASGAYSLLAAERPDIADKVKYVIAVSPWFNAGNILKAIYLQRFEEGGKTYTWIPPAGSYDTTTRSIIHYSTEEKEWGILEEAVKENTAPENLGEISPNGLAVYKYATNRDPSKYEELKAALPWENFDLAKISPDLKIEDLKAKVFLITDKKDTWVPHTESNYLEKSLPSLQIKHVELDILEHTQLLRKLPRLFMVVEIGKLGIFTYQTLLAIS